MRSRPGSPRRVPTRAPCPPRRASRAVPRVAGMARSCSPCPPARPDHTVARATTSPTAHVPWRWAVLGGCIGALLSLLLFAPARWLATRVASATDGQVLLLDPRGTVWTGSGQLLLTGGANSRDAATLPTRMEWRLRPSFAGLRVLVSSACCTPQPLAVTVVPG